MILTGASRGIGASLARIYLSQSKDHNLVAVARTKDSLDQLAAEFGSRVVVVSGDVTDPEVSARAVREAISHFGVINSVVANAGVLDPVDTVAKADVSRWRQLYDINFFSVVDLVAAALPHLEKSHGRIVAVSSGACETPYFGWCAYGSSKAALNHLMMSVAEENPNVGAISVAPGVVATSMQEDIREKFGANMTPESLQRFVDLHTNGKLSPPELPATVYTNLAVRGWTKEMNGKYFRVGDSTLKAYENSESA
ncbi:putative sepiapterin reductase [Clavispora lusitaniae]|uniref:Sepiapterin reductase n=1 Tax=Clavispora lusitaniae TaxID=36911 RepID=A0AA91Q1A9_CLALS|nr:putative sepiapterin reductase [Clavispora lusitaniae]